MENKSLSTLVMEMSQVVAQIAEGGGELSPELEAMFDQVGKDIEVKADGYAFFMERLELESKYWKEKAEALSKVSKSCLALKDRLNERIKEAMAVLNTDEIKGQDVRFKLSKVAPRLVIDESLSSEYKMQITELVPDKERIKHDLGVGIEIPGARLEQGFALRKYLNKKG